MDIAGTQGGLAIGRKQLAARGMRSPSPAAYNENQKPKAKRHKPKLLVDVEYRALTSDGKLRHSSFKGVREEL
jgi:ATP-dependent DNA ligase